MRDAAFPLLVLAAFASPCRAADEPVNNEFFEKKVRPILAAHCVDCHGPKKDKGGLRLDTKANFAKGGDTGPSVVAGNPDKSLLVQVVRYADDIKMPPKRKLEDADIATLTAWVKGGAPWPDDGGAGAKIEAFDVQARAKAHWSFRPITRPASPEIRNPKSEMKSTGSCSRSSTRPGSRSRRRPTSEPCYAGSTST